MPWLIVTGFFIACGSRTALIVSEVEEGGAPDAGPDRRDGGRDQSIDVPDDPQDDLPMIDTSKPDVPTPNDCPDAGSTVVYLISNANDLMSFFPPNLSFKTIGKINCPGVMMGDSPFSMGVDRKGAAFVVFWQSGKLFKVSTLTAACTATTFTPGPMNGFFNFGMGFSGDNNGESLYVAGSGTPSAGLATIDTQGMFGFKFIAQFNPSLDRTELTGTGDGRLYGWSPNSDPNGTGSRLVEIDRSNAKVIAANKLLIGTPNDAFAFAFWGGDFWIFTSQGGPTTVTKYDPGTLKESTATTTNVEIVGAGVSTCAPSQ